MCAVDTSNTEGEHVAFNQITAFVQQAGGFGGPRTSDKSIMPVDAPQRAPDVSVCDQTLVDQVSNGLTHLLLYVLHFIVGMKVGYSQRNWKRKHRRLKR